MAQITWPNDSTNAMELNHQFMDPTISELMHIDR